MEVSDRHFFVFVFVFKLAMEFTEVIMMVYEPW